MLHELGAFEHSMTRATASGEPSLTARRSDSKATDRKAVGISVHGAELSWLKTAWRVVSLCMAVPGARGGEEESPRGEELSGWEAQEPAKKKSRKCS